MATNPEFRRTILIGLGGAGQLILTHLKRLFLDIYGVVPPSIKLLSLDTDATQVKLPSALGDREYSLDTQEFLHLKVSQPVEFIRNDKVVTNWYVKPLPVGAIENGAGAVRQNGRLAFFYHVREFLTRIDDITTAVNAANLPLKMQNARAEMHASSDFTLSARNPEVYVCGSLAGGTGSGTFIDVGILLRRHMPNALVHGFFLLNWIYRNKAWAHRVPGNVYAALAELDDLQSIMFGAPDFVPYKITYANREVEVEKSPYDLFHLIDGRNEHGENIDDLDHLCDTVADAIFLSVGSMGDPIKSVADNLLAHINTQNPGIWDGRYARYSSLGVSSLYYPARELHHLTAADNAVNLCRAAIAEVKGEIADSGRAAQREEQIAQDLEALFNQLTLSRVNIRNSLCPFRSDISFQVEKFELAANIVLLLPEKKTSAERDLETQLDGVFARHGRLFIDSVLQVLQQKIAQLQKDPKLDSAYLQRWIAQASDRLTAWSNEAADDLNTITQRVEGERKAADDSWEIVSKSRYIPIPWIGGSKPKAAEKWAEQVRLLLETIRDKKILEYEQHFHRASLAELGRHGLTTVATGSEITDALLEAEGQLRKVAAAENERLKRLKSKPSQVLIGNGNIVVVPDTQDGTTLRDSITVEYGKFKTDSNVQTAEDYLRLYREDPKKLATLFINYCRNELERRGLTSVSVEQALDAIGKSHEERGEKTKERYIEEQFNHLFRLSSALWSFDRGKLNTVRTEQYDKITNIGVDEQAKGKAKYGKIIENVKPKYNIRADHTFSTTHEKYHVWLLNYAAALPIYFLSDLSYNKQRYEEEISPTYHIDKYFEMNVPDLFPVNDVDNITLRVLGMAIVPGIDVILDEKMLKGHKFTCDADPIKQLNFGDPKIWYLFRDMYADVVSTYDQKSSDNLLNILINLLKEKVGALSQAQLKTSIEVYIEKVKEKLNSRDFSRLISARLTYREIKELEKFLVPIPRGGYGMNIERYINGN